MTDPELLAGADAIYLDTSVLPKIYLQEAADNGPAILLFGFSQIPLFCSLVVVGEFFSVMGLRRTQETIGVPGYLYRCVALLHDLETGRLRHIEPVEGASEFFQLADQLVARRGGLGGGDIWHLMATAHLKQQFPSAVLLSYDDRLVSAARQEGLAAVDGGSVDTIALEDALRTAGRWLKVPGAAEQRVEADEAG